MHSADGSLPAPPVRARHGFAWRGVVGSVLLTALLGGTVLLLTRGQATAQDKQGTLATDRDPAQFEESRPGKGLTVVKRYIRLDLAQTEFKVSGENMTIAVLDSGLRTTHVDFSKRVLERWNCSREGLKEDVTDLHGSGTHLCGVVAAQGFHHGIAPAAQIVPVKVMTRDGAANFLALEEALRWVLKNQKRLRISVVLTSLSDRGNYQDDKQFVKTGTATLIAQLRELGVPVVVPAGDRYFPHKSRQGMTYPAVLAQTISVGAVYNTQAGEPVPVEEARAVSTRPDQITPFSQRLHEKTNPRCRTDIFAPGGLLRSTGKLTDRGEALQQGTSQAAAVVAGVLLLMQQHHQRLKGQLASVDDLEVWLRRGGVVIEDRNRGEDNVQHTGETFYRLDAYGALLAMQRQFQIEALRKVKK